MKKKALVAMICLMIAIAFAYTMYSTWGAIRPAWFTSSLNQSEIIERFNEEDQTLFDLNPTFSQTIHQADFDNPRVLIEDSKGQIIISEPDAGRISLYVDNQRFTLISDLNLPHGLALLDTTLYVAETGQVLAFDYDPEQRLLSNKRAVLDLPSGSLHWTRSLGIGPDRLLYISIGSSCNICLEDDWRRTKLLRYNPETQELETYASGLRNSVFFAWHPMTNQLFATEMGRDWLGDDLPPDELNILEQGADYGFPYCYGKNIIDPEFNDPEKCDTANASTYDFNAHESPLGIDFYGNDLIIALHGSWNREEPVGYQVIRLSEASDYQERTVLLDGFLQEDGTSIGRPAGVLVHSDGSIYISDDKSDLLYQLIPQGL